MSLWDKHLREGRGCCRGGKVSQQGRAGELADRDKLQTLSRPLFPSRAHEVRITHEDVWGRGSEIQLLKHQGHKSSWPDTARICLDPNPPTLGILVP